jgi:hypothetical protein
LELTLSFAVCVPHEIIKVVRQCFDQVYKQRLLYRATGVTLSDITEKDTATLDLFNESEKIEKVKKIYQTVDLISAKYGKHSVFLGSSFMAIKSPEHQSTRGDKSERSKNLFKGETKRRRIGIPFIGTVK